LRLSVNVQKQCFSFRGKGEEKVKKGEIRSNKKKKKERGKKRKRGSILVGGRLPLDVEVGWTPLNTF